VSDDTVMRDIFYNGNGKPEKCAVVLRLAPTWFRIGSLEILAKNGEIPELNQLVDFLLENQFLHLKVRIVSKNKIIGVQSSNKCSLGNV
jgi:uncharacterized protein YdiU (UPF0061 family)